MRKSARRWLLGIVLSGAVAAGLAVALWAGLTHRPDFYRTLLVLDPARRQQRADEFVSHSSQLRNDIVNESRWEAVFTAEEINAWLAEDLAQQFADRIPPGVSDPRVLFEPDRVTLAFTHSAGAVQSVVWAVARLRVVGPNEVAFTFEKVRAGALPVPSDVLLGEFQNRGAGLGLRLSWSKDGDLPVATVRYEPASDSRPIVLESVQVADGWVRLAGRTGSTAEARVSHRLSNRQVLQLTLPRRKRQPF
jgi:hypothetical protein